MQNSYAIILAAGKGTRMNSQSPKVLSDLNGKPLMYWVLDSIKEAGFLNIVVVVGYGAEEVKQAIKQAGYGVIFAYQDEQLGTGHAAQIGLAQVPPSATSVLVTYGDMPFVSGTTYRNLIQKQQSDKAGVVLTTVTFDDPMSPAFGRIIRDTEGKIMGVVEQKVCSDEQLRIQECNAGPVAYDRLWLSEALPKVKRNPYSNEYYLTDLAELAYDQHKLVEAVAIPDPTHAHGVNTPEHLQTAHAISNGMNT